MLEKPKKAGWKRATTPSRTSSPPSPRPGGDGRRRVAALPGLLGVQAAAEGHHRRLDFAIAMGEQLFRLKLREAGQQGHDPPRAIDQLAVGGPQIDHQVAVGLAQSDHRAGADHVEDHLGRRARLKRVEPVMTSGPTIGTIITSAARPGRPLGHMAGTKGEHFFRSTLVQTIFYGIFSAWVLWCRSNMPSSQTSSFDWKQAQWIITVPFIRTLFENLMMPGKLKPLGLVEILDRANSVLNRVDRPVFFGKFQEEHAVQYFYEPFLEAFDPNLRKELGVWYTPREIVKYQVARIDKILRTEMGLADGLADPSVLVLDPCCGTGTYLVEVLNQIASALKAKGGGAFVAAEIKRAAITKVFGFEILPAPFVVSHLQIGLLLQKIGSPLMTTSNERAAVFLTNSLTGWDPTKAAKPIPFPELAQEHEKADKVKQSSRIIVVLGNPPYNAFAGHKPGRRTGPCRAIQKGIKPASF